MKFTRLMALVLALALLPVLFIACSSAEEEPVAEQPAADEEPEVTEEEPATSYSPPDQNLVLSTNRANAVRAWFEEWAAGNGADWVLLAEGRGCTELKVPDFDVEGNFLEAAGALNRRVEIEIEDVN